MAFSNRLVVHKRNGIPTLQFRIANERKNEIFGASVRVTVLIEEVTAEGERMRRFHDVPLERHETPLFTIAWTCIHRLDETSPLIAADKKSLTENMLFLLVTFSGTDATLMQTVQARKLYELTDVRLNARFVDMIENTSDGMILVHHENLHKIEPM